MKMGFITSLFDGWTYEEMIDEVARLGIKCVEVAAWPKGKAERKYGGVTHIEAERVLEDDAYAQHLLDYAAEKNVRICAIAYYPNNLDPDLERRRTFNDHLVACIHAAAKLGVPKVTTFIGRVTNKTFRRAQGDDLHWSRDKQDLRGEPRDRPRGLDSHPQGRRGRGHPRVHRELPDAL